MCGRYQFSDADYDEFEEIVRHAQQRSRNSELNFKTVSDICPTMTAPILVANGSKAAAVFMPWGLPNQYNKRMINVRAETVTQKPMFRRAIAGKRCVVPVSGFYEWGTRKQQYLFTLPRQPIYLAGIYDRYDETDYFVILTTEPNESVQDIHNRMPLMIPRDKITAWLTDPASALDLLVTRPPLLQHKSLSGQISLFDIL